MSDTDTYTGIQVVPFVKTHRIGRLDIDCVTVKLTPEEWKVCHDVSSNMWANSKTGHYGKGLINTKEDPYFAERVGKLGEVAFSKISGLPVDTKYKDKGDDFDFITDAGKIDIKTSCKLPSYKKLLVTGATSTRKLYDIKSDIFVSAFLAYEDREARKATIVIVGWCNKDQLMKGGLQKGRAGKHFNYEVHYRNLRPIAELLEMINPEIDTVTIKPEEEENVITAQGSK
jgi:hypothetical protein